MQRTETNGPRPLSGGILPLTLAALVVLAPAPGAARQTPPGDERGVFLQAHRLGNGEANGLRLDGLLDEDAWARAVPVSDFTQQEPVEGARPSRPTEVRVVYDADAIYIGAMIFDDPEGILAYQKRRDAGLNTDDRFMWILDTFLDGRTGYFFEINAAGLMGDGLITGGGGGGGFGGGGGGWGINKSWDGIWEARVARLDDGWSAEIRIPLRTLNFDPSSDTWGINFQRTIRRRNEEIVWRGHRRNQNLTSPIHAGRLVGLEGLSQGIGLEAQASAVAGWRNVVENEDPTTFPKDVSLDLGYSITPSLRASVSVNTDFAEVEVDDRRVNLTRFPLRFPERRNFFLEGSGVFSFASSSGPSPYFSRDIGLYRGEQVPIRYGARLGGQVGRWELGFVQVSTGRLAYLEEEDGIELEAELPPEDFTVARVRRSFWTQSTLGAIYTRRHTGVAPDGFTAPDRHTAGVDLNLETSTLFGDKNAQLEAFWVWNSDAEPDGERSLSELTARGVRFAFPNDPWSGHLSYREFGSAYDPQVGFVQRNDFRRVEPRIGWQPRPDWIEAIRSFDFSAQYTYLEELGSGTPEERQWQFDVLGIRMESGDDFDVRVNRLYEHLDHSFEVSDGIEILPGGYTNWEWSVDLRTASRRRLSGGFDYGRGGFWDGDRTRYETRLTLRPQPGVSLSWDWERNEVTLPQGSFDASVYRLGGGWDASPWISLNGNLQYDDVSDIVGLFARLRWIVKPGNDVYLVYTHNWQRLFDDVLDRRFATLSRGASLKVNYTYRF